MVRRIIFIAAGVIYLGVLGCVDWSTPPVSMPFIAPQLVDLHGLRAYAGVAIELDRVDWVDQYEKTIDDAAADGADTISLVVSARQENFESNYMYVDFRKAMTDVQLSEIIHHCKEKKLHVMLMPIVLLDDPTDPHWRGTIHPKDWDVWFDNYRDMIDHYAYIAQAGGVDIMAVGSELVSSETYREQWLQTIKSVRDIYHGQLTYSSNWDRYWEVPFWDYLDFVGMNSYWKLGEDGSVSVAQIEKKWAEIQGDMFGNGPHHIHKPILLCEAGWCSLPNSAKDPWDYTNTSLPVDNELQRKLYQAFFESWWGKPQLAGMMIWDFYPGGDPNGRGYTPQGKPAENVLKQFFALPRWPVEISN